MSEPPADDPPPEQKPDETEIDADPRDIEIDEIRFKIFGGEPPRRKRPLLPSDVKIVERPSPPAPPAEPPIEFRPSIAESIVAASTTPRRQAIGGAARDLAISAVSLLERCPECFRKVIGGSDEVYVDSEGQKWHAGCQSKR